MTEQDLPEKIAPVKALETEKEGVVAARVGIIIVIVLGVLFVILASVVAINLPTFLKQHQDQRGCTLEGDGVGCGLDQQGSNRNNSADTNSGKPVSNANITVGKMSYFAPSSWKELTYPGTDQSTKVDMRANVIANSNGVSLIGVFHSATPDSQPVFGLERQKQKTNNAYDVMSGLGLDRMLSARYTYGEPYLSCASDFVYTEPLTKVMDAKTGKYGVEYAYTCKADNGYVVRGFHGSYYDSGDTLHSFEIVGIDTSWDKHLDEIKQIRDSITVK